MSWCRKNAPHRPARPLTRTVLVLVTVLAGLALASPSQAAVTHGEPDRAWSATTTTVCVESHVSKDWDVAGAVRRWNKLDGAPTFVLGDACTDYDGSIVVRYRNDATVYTGWTTWFWNDDAQIVHADVTLNPRRLKAYARGDYQCLRSWTTTHELGHALGLRHYPRSHAGSVMSYLGWERGCGRLSAHDRADYHHLYPASQ